ncbi:uncharacterized protein CLUP02_11258 [Colletotrichum lupini]|uniref:Uncharacterized protein n=1 Tax=Colletotrichum lupini TaxID=145971 RepID=A0A9Q8SYA8_9PEZI|nr:uncharacterized protein CLUP02_11258 [Colletotrichum lupini]UQC85759.1 hypothetical protein CLUP02_11258 [Colletotrichum lupini]
MSSMALVSPSCCQVDAKLLPNATPDSETGVEKDKTNHFTPLSARILWSVYFTNQGTPRCFQRVIDAPKRLVNKRFLEKRNAFCGLEWQIMKLLTSLASTAFSVGLTDGFSIIQFLLPGDKLAIAESNANVWSQADATRSTMPALISRPNVLGRSRANHGRSEKISTAEIQQSFGETTHSTSLLN